MDQSFKEKLEVGRTQWIKLFQSAALVHQFISNMRCHINTKVIKIKINPCRYLTCERMFYNFFSPPDQDGKLWGDNFWSKLQLSTVHRTRTVLLPLLLQRKQPHVEVHKPPNKAGNTGCAVLTAAASHWKNRPSSFRNKNPLKSLKLGSSLLLAYRPPCLAAVTDASRQPRG